MTEILKDQYTHLQSARDIVLNFIETDIKHDLYTPIAEYDNLTIRDLLLHVSYCYFQWLAVFAMQQSVEWLDHAETQTISHIRQLYHKVDETVANFLEDFRYRRDPISNVHNAIGRLSATPVQIFTHTLTHEFHHKGQIMTMCRILGHTPPETDISLFFNQVNSPLFAIS